MTTTLQPLQQNQRDKNLDILRGFALAGVLFVFCAGDMGIAENFSNSVLDDAIEWFKKIMVEERMYSMLILVFGIGFSVQLQKAKQKRKSLVPAFVRRSIGLILIGFLHGVFLSSRDFLLFYGIAGLMLLPARDFSVRQLVAFMLIVWIVWYEWPFILQILNIETVKITSWISDSPNDYSSYLKFNWQWFKEYHQQYGNYFDMLLYFLIGFYIGNSNILGKIEREKKLRHYLLVISFILAAALAAFYFGWLGNGGYQVVFKNIKNDVFKEFVKAGIALGGIILRLSFVTLYACLLIAINSSRAGQKRLRPLSAFGQMALSNYLIQSLILVPYALLFDQFNNMPPFKGTILFLIVFAFQLAFSSWWLKRFLFGPFEWLLRSFTYWKWQPMKKKEIAKPPEEGL